MLRAAHCDCALRRRQAGMPVVLWGDDRQECLSYLGRCDWAGRNACPTFFILVAIIVLSSSIMIGTRIGTRIGTKIGMMKIGNGFPGWRYGYISTRPSGGNRPGLQPRLSLVLGLSAFRPLFMRLPRPAPTLDRLLVEVDALRHVPYSEHQSGAVGWFLIV